MLRHHRQRRAEPERQLSPDGVLVAATRTSSDNVWKSPLETRTGKAFSGHRNRGGDLALGRALASQDLI